MYAPTSLEEYHRLAPTRPYTDWPMGKATASRRSRDARLSALMHGHERPRTGVRIVKSPWTGRTYLVRPKLPW
jgi:hypothetical protein